jgi:TrmH family RNA methyltransferase
MGDISKGFTLFLDEIRDPGNLGTILRTAAWYGITQIVLSEGCADVYNPKTIQSAMGSIWKVNHEYVEKIAWLKAYKNNGLPIYGAFLNGENIHLKKFAKSGLLILGNEGAGISSEAAQFVTHKITIPGSGMVESLNVASAAAILCDTIYRNKEG